MLKPDFRLVKTSDGSDTLFSDTMNESYHSVNGAIQESMHVFISNGLEKLIDASESSINVSESIFKTNTPVNILEIGFGTGLNCLLTWIEANKRNLSVNYETIEAFPLSKEITDSLNYGRIIDESYQNTFLNIHNCDWEEWINPEDFSQNKKPGCDTLSKELRAPELTLLAASSEGSSFPYRNNPFCANPAAEQRGMRTPEFRLKKINADFTSYELNSGYDLVYYDAFAPNKQPELWEEQLFLKLYNAINPGGILVTYCAMGEVRRRLQRSGFTTSRLPGPPGKREMLFAKKIL